VSIAAALDGAVTPANEFCCDGGTAIVAFARRAGIPAHVLPMPGKPNPKEPDFTSTTSMPTIAAEGMLCRFHGVATKISRTISDGAAPRGAGQNVTSTAMILGAIGMGHINKQRYKSQLFSLPRRLCYSPLMAERQIAS